MSLPRIKVFIIDDSVLVRFALTQLLNREEDLEVVGDAAASSHLKEQISKAKPDILILDVPIPREKGIRDLKNIHTFHLPVIVFTRSDKTIAQDLIPLLDAGAVGFVLKPDKDEDLVGVRDQLLYELRRNVQLKKVEALATHTKAPSLQYLDPLWVVAIGSSTGGPEALASIIDQFPATFPYGIAIVQHMPADFTKRFAERLNQMASIQVKEAEEGDILRAGLALVAPGDFHMVFTEEHEGNRIHARVRLTKEPPQWKLRPTVDSMMLSLAPIYKSRTVGVILTGMGEDGVIGMRAIKQQGGRTVVQNKATSAVFGMGQEVIKNNLADTVLPLSKIVPHILETLSL